MSEPRAPSLPDLPNVWGEVDSVLEGRFRQRWVPGAFGERTDIRGVERYRVVRAEWVEEGEGGLPERTILEGVAL